MATSTKTRIKKAIQAKHAKTDSSHSEDLQDIIVPTWAYLSPFSSLLCSQEKVLIEKLGEHFKKQIRKMQIMTFPTMTIRCKNHFLWAQSHHCPSSAHGAGPYGKGVTYEGVYFSCEVMPRGGKNPSCIKNIRLLVNFSASFKNCCNFFTDLKNIIKKHFFSKISQPTLRLKIFYMFLFAFVMLFNYFLKSI